MHEELLKTSSPKVDMDTKEIPSVVEVVDPNLQPKKRKVSELATTDDETSTDRDGNATPTAPGAITVDTSGSRRKYRVVRNFFHTLHILRVTYTYFVCTYATTS